MTDNITSKMSNLQLQKSLDAFLVPGMMNLNVLDAFDVIGNLCHEMRESEILCRRLVTRLSFLRERALQLEHAKKIPAFADVLGHAIAFLKKYTPKKLLQRIALNRNILQGVRTLHREIDDLFKVTELTSAAEMSMWNQHWEDDIASQIALLDQLTASPQVATELASGSLEEALTEIKFEIDRRMNPPAFTDLMTRVLAGVEVRMNLPPTQEVPRWYIRRDDVELVDDAFDCGSFGEVRMAKWGAAKTDVVVKSLYMDTPDAQQSFLRETKVWYELSHPHIIKMHGGCHVGKPLFFVSEYAPGKNFNDFFERSKENKRQMWRLFHEAAQGLLHLHTQTPPIIHGDIKCNNMLVGPGGKAKLCDFGYAFIRTLSVGKSVKEQPSTTRWKAPECLLGQGAEANPSPESDTYSFGMSIIEAVTGELPYGMADDETIIEHVADGKEYPRPKTGFTDKQWDLVQKMTADEVEHRMNLADAIKVLKDLADEELNAVLCPVCKHENIPSNKFCGECGASLSTIYDSEVSSSG